MPYGYGEDIEMPECEWVKDSCGYYCRTHDGSCSVRIDEHEGKPHECDRSGDYLLATMKSLKKEAYEEGQQNPDPKQYAKREELVEEIEKEKEKLIVELHDDSLPIFVTAYDRFVNIINKHGLEE